MSSAPTTPSGQLLPGQRLSREEFLRRWEQLPELKNAELIDGLVYMSSPVSIGHGEIEVPLASLLHLYAINTPGCKAGTNTTWLMLESAPQPDLHLRLLPEFGGLSKVSEKYPQGTPELVIEITVSSQHSDAGPKRALYQRAGVREYVTVLVESAEVSWRCLDEKGSYERVAPDANGWYRSRAFPGLWLDAKALFEDEGQRLLNVLQQGLGSPEHTAFVAELESRRTA